MKKIVPVAMALLLAAGMTGCAEEKTAVNPAAEQPVAAAPKAEQAPPSNLNVERTSSNTTVATVEAIDLKKRIVTLKSIEGRTFTIHVGEQAVNLPQVRKGDKVEITYSESLEVRMAEPGEVLADSTTVIGKAAPGSKPRGIGITETNITATILNLDKSQETATLEMADGTVATVKVQNPANLDKVKVGDVIAISYLEALEIKVMGKKR
jgi:hypothetical protein